MPADQPTILATSGGAVAADRIRWGVGPLTDLAVDLSGVSGRAPKVCFLGTACGDSPALVRDFYDAAQVRGFHGSHLQLFTMPNVEDITAHLLEQDVVWVWGGSVAGLLAMWRLHGVDEAMRTAWEAGIVLTGVSAGSICWHVGGTTDSFGPELLYRGTEMVQAYAERDGAGAYLVERDGDRAVETELDVARL